MLAQKTETEFNVYETLKRYSLDVIWNCAFGVDIDVQQSDEGIGYYYKCEEFFKNHEAINIFSFVGGIVKFLIFNVFKNTLKTLICIIKKFICMN